MQDANCFLKARAHVAAWMHQANGHEDFFLEGLAPRWGRKRHGLWEEHRRAIWNIEQDGEWYMVRNDTSSVLLPLRGEEVLDYVQAILEDWQGVSKISFCLKQGEVIHKCTPWEVRGVLRTLLLGGKLPPKLDKSRSLRSTEKRAR